MCIPAFCITPSWPPFSVSVRLIENRLTEIFSVNRLTENIPTFCHVHRRFSIRRASPSGLRKGYP